jgi:hypothetical protein
MLKKIRWLAGTAVLGLGLAFGVPAASASGSGQSHATEVDVIGGGTFQLNTFVKDTMHWTPGKIVVHSGSSLVLVDKATDPDPHTFTLAPASAVPRNFEQAIEGNAFTQGVLAAHGQPPNLKQFVNKGGPGFDTVGDSVMFDKSKKYNHVTIKITAKHGSKFYFICSVHPWMVGTLIVK